MTDPVTDPVLDVEARGPIRVLRLQRPDRRNALDVALCRALHEQAQRAVDDGARVLVITGEGSAFCAGADLDGVYGEEFLQALYGMLHGLGALPVPVIAAVNGPAIGAGTQLALACDLRVAAPGARFAIPTARNGMAVDAWTIRSLAAVTGRGVAARLMLAAETLGVEAATAAGLVDRAGDLDDALAWADEIASLAPLTLAYNKLVLRGDPASAAEQRDLARAVEAGFDVCWASDDVREASRARAERRPPEFSGR